MSIYDQEQFKDKIFNNKELYRFAINATKYR